jgi:DNA-binding transcriptional LysR family regulator
VALRYQERCFRLYGVFTKVMTGGRVAGEHWSSQDVNFLDLDLNLLIALDALLSERSVTKAAERLSRSQPALSASLKRLRRQFDDELLVRVGNHFELSPLAEQLSDRLAVVLSDIERVFATRARFDPSQAKREFVLATSDYPNVVLGPTVADLVAAEAPDVTLRFVTISDQIVDNPAEQLRVYDGMFLPKGFVGDVPHLVAYRDRWVILADANNAVTKQPVTTEALANLDWVMPFHRRGFGIPPMRQMELRGIELRVTIATDGFVGLPALIAGSGRVAFIQEKLAIHLASSSQFAIIDCPFEVVPLDEALWWHPTLTADPGHMWFRELVRRAGTIVSEQSLEVEHQARTH